MPTRKENIKSWMKTLTLGLVSGLSCFCCFGGFGGRLNAPFKNKIYPGDQVENMDQWVEHGCIAIRCVPFCGLCCGCCGVLEPKDLV